MRTNVEKLQLHPGPSPPGPSPPGPSPPSPAPPPLNPTFDCTPFGDNQHVCNSQSNCIYCTFNNNCINVADAYQCSDVPITPIGPPLKPQPADCRAVNYTNVCNVNCMNLPEDKTCPPKQCTPDQTGYQTYGCDGTSPFSPLCSQFIKTTQCGEPTQSGLKSLCKSMYYDVPKTAIY